MPSDRREILFLKLIILVCLPNQLTLTLSSNYLQQEGLILPSVCLSVPLSVCLFVCLQLHVKTTARIFVELLLEMCLCKMKKIMEAVHLWTRIQEFLKDSPTLRYTAFSNSLAATL